MRQKKYLNRYKSFQCSLSSLAEARKRDLPVFEHFRNNAAGYMEKMEKDDEL